MKVTPEDLPLAIYRDCFPSRICTYIKIFLPKKKSRKMVTFYKFYVPFNVIDSYINRNSFSFKTQDWRCFTYTVVPKIAMLERFTLGPLRVTFRQWTCYIAVKSIITHAEVWSQGLLVASALRARDCRGAEMHLAKRGDSPSFL